MNTLHRFIKSPNEDDEDNEDIFAELDAIDSETEEVDSFDVSHETNIFDELDAIDNETESGNSLGNIWGGVKVLGGQIPSLFGDVIPETIGRTIRRGDETIEETPLDKWIQKNVEERQKAKTLTPEEREETVVEAFGGKITKGDVEDAADSLGYTFVNSIVSQSAKALTTLALAPILTPLGSTIAGLGAGFVGGTAVSQGATKDQFIEMVKDEWEIAHAGEVMTPELQQQWQEIYNEFEGQADWYGFWEAAPETAGNLFMFGLAKLPVGKLLKPALAKLKNKVTFGVGTKIAKTVGIPAAKLLAMLTEESITETLTTKKQSEIEYEAGLRDRPLSYTESFKEVLPMILITTPIMGGVAGGVAKLSKKLSEERQEVFDDLEVIDEGKEPVKKPKKYRIDNSKEIFAGIQKDYLAGKLKDSDVKALKDQLPDTPIGKDFGKRFDSILAEGQKQRETAEAEAKQAEDLGTVKTIESVGTRLFGERFEKGKVGVAPETDETKNVRTVAKALKMGNINFYDAGGTQLNQVNGFYDTATKQIYINKDTDRPLLVVMGHESLHKIKRDAPDLYKSLKPILTGKALGFKEYVNKLNKARGSAGLGEADIAKASEEFIADFVGTTMTKASFWKKLHEQDPVITRKLADVLTELIKKIRKALTGRDAKKYFKDLDAIETEIAKIYAQYARPEAKKEAVSGIPKITSTFEAKEFAKIATPEQIEQIRAQREEILERAGKLADQSKESMLAGDIEKATKLISDAGFLTQSEAAFLKEAIQAYEGRDFEKKQREEAEKKKTEQPPATEEAKKPPSPKKPRKQGIPAKKKEEKKAPTPEDMLAEWDRQVKAKGKETVDHASKAVQALKDVNKILGEKGEISGEFNEDKWKQIRPLLKTAWDETLAAGKSAAEFVALAIETLSPKGRPYFERFVKEEMGEPAEKAKKPTREPAYTYAVGVLSGGPAGRLKEKLDKMGYEMAYDDEAKPLEKGSELYYEVVGAIAGRADRFVDRGLTIRKKKEVKPAKATSKRTPSLKLAKWVSDKVMSGVNITWRDLFKQADVFFKGTQAEGVYVGRDAYDAMELGINMAMLESQGPFTEKASVAAENATILKEFLGLIPTQTKRTTEQQEFQQFSTPPPLAYMANWVANIQKGETYLEPSAGVGGLAVFGKIEGANVIVNELSPRRSTLLELLGFKEIYNEDAEQLDNILPDTVKPTVIVMNPPFSSTAGRLKTNQTKYGGRHVEQALHRLEPNGRLVAIVGKGMAMDAPAHREWWKKIQANYGVRANIRVSGKEYAKYGTTFDNRILVIDKTEKKDYIIVQGKVETVEELPALLQDIRKDRKEVQDGSKYIRDRQGKPAPPKSTRSETTETGEGAGRKTPDTPDSTTGLGGTKRGSGAGSATIQPGQDAGISTRDERPAKDSGSAETGRDVETGRSGETGRGSGTKVSRSDAGKSGLKVTSEKETKREGEISDSLYENYLARVTIAGAQPHPTPLVESAAMADTTSPKTDYVPDIPLEVIKSGKISDIQLEQAVYAGAAHEKILPNGERRGYFDGDGTGVGKGRTIAAILWDNWRRGRKKAVWFSEKASLFKDAQRDVKQAGWESGVEKLFKLSGTKLGNKVQAEEGIMFGTYSTLGSKYEDLNEQEPESLQNMRIRINQVIDWFGKDYDGVIVFDESHNMGNAVPVRGKRGMQKPAKMAMAGVTLQKLLPKARVVYMSATGATEVSNLTYARRLGLWGRGTSFSNATKFIGEVESGGLMAMELLARDMKSQGSYLARTLSYEGVEHDRLEHKLNNSERKMYDVLSTAWQTILHNIDAAVEETQSKAKMSIFWGAHQRFFQSVVVSLQTPSVIKHAKERLANKEAVVIQLVDTGEAQQNRSIDSMQEGQDYEDLDFTPRENMVNYLKNSFPVQQFEKYLDEDGKERTRPVFDSNGEPVLNRQAVARRDRLIAEAASIKVPASSLDRLIEAFGAENVAEVTGRSRRLVPDENGDLVMKKRTDSIINQEIQDFEDDNRKVLIFSGKGGTGASYHADKDFKNQRRRNHYLLQPGWRADKAIQGLGRSHRSNQAVAPFFYLVSTDLEGQKRFLSTIARRLDQLGSLTKGQRQTGSQGIFKARDNLENDYARNALVRMFEDLDGELIEGISAEEYTEQTGLSLRNEDGAFTPPSMRQFLNRLLSMNIPYQNLVFNHFNNKLDVIVQTAAENGTLDVGVETITGVDVKKVKEEVIHTDKESKAQTKYVSIDVTNETQKIDFKDSKDVFYRKSGGTEYMQNIRSKRIWVISDIHQKTNEDGSIDEYRRLKGPNYYTSQQIKATVLKNPELWKKASTEEARALWNKEFKDLPDTSTSKIHMITGAILPIWERLPRGETKIFRTQTNEGERLLGRVIPESMLKQTLENFGVGVEKIKMEGKDIARQVLEYGSVVRLSNGWRIKRARVSGEQRIELTGPSWGDTHEIKKAGVFDEIIGYQTRYFIPKASAGTVIDELIEYRDIISFKQGYTGPAVAELSVKKKDQLDLFEKKKAEKDIFGEEKQKVAEKKVEPKAVFGQKMTPKGKKKPDTPTEKQLGLFGKDKKQIQTTMFSVKDPVPVWYSQMEDVLDKKLPNKGTPESMKQAIASFAKKGEFKKDELEWSGLNEWLDEQTGKVTKLEIYTWLALNNIRVDEVVKGEPSEADIDIFLNDEVGEGFTREEAREYLLKDEGAIKFSQWQEPGAENYKEVLLTLPSYKFDPKVQARVDELNKKVNEYKATKEEQIELNRILEKRNTEEYTGGHWEEPNVLVHLRLNERTDSEGAKVLFLEEIQSDIHQEGRKKGYRQDKKLPEGFYFKKEEYGGTKDAVALYDNENNRLRVGSSKKDVLREYWRDIAGVPDMPFKKSWPLLAFKKAVRMGAEGGFDKIGWTSGETQIRRYWGNEVVSDAVDRFKEITKPDSVIELAKDVFGGKMASLMSLDHVDGGMLAMLKNDKVREVVAANLPVDVMDLFRANNLSPNQIFSKDDVVIDRLPVDSRTRVANGILRTIRDTGTTIRTKLSNLSLGGGEIELYPTLRASDLNSREVAGIIAPSALFHLGSRMSPEKAAATGAVAKTLSPEERRIFGSKFSPAKLAEFLNFHKEIISGREGIVKEGFEAPPGEGMKSFYDKMLVNEVNKFFNKKKWGKAKVGTTTFGGRGFEYQALDHKGESLGVFPTRNEAEHQVNLFYKRDGIRGKVFKQPIGQDVMEAWTLPITPEMKEKALKEGMPMFSVKDKQLSPLAQEYLDMLIVAHTELTSESDTNNDPFSGLRKEVAERMELNKGLGKPARFEKVKSFPRSVWNLFTRSFEDLDPKQYGGISNVLRLHKEVSTSSRRRASTLIWNIIGGLHPNQYDIFRMEIIISDMLKDLDSGLLSSMEGLPFGFRNKAEVKAYHNEIMRSVNADPVIKNALRRRNLVNQKLKTVLVRNGLLHDSVLEDDRYYHHQVMEYRAAKELGNEWSLKAGTGTQALAMRKKGWQKARKGHIGDYNTDYFQAEFEVMAQSFAQLETKHTLRRLKGLIDMTAALKLQAKAMEIEWKDFTLPKGLTTWQPAPGSAWFRASSLTDKMMMAIQVGDITDPEIIKNVWAKGKDATWIVPDEIAKTLDEFGKGNIADKNIDLFSRTAITMWKKWILINPYRIIKYNLNNMSGDFDIAFAYNPKIMKYFNQARKDLWAEFKGKPLSDELKGELDLGYRQGVIGSGWAMQDIEGVAKALSYDKKMQELTDTKPGYIQRAWKWSADITTFRENILRLAAYRYFKDRIEGGETGIYAASNREEVDAIQGDVEKAAKLARDLIGDYGNISAGGQWLRRHAIPFYSWMEVNAPRYVRLLRNLKHEGQGTGRAAGVISARVAWKGTKLAVKATALMGAVMLWNSTFFPDEEDELSESQRRQMHLILGRRKDGSIMTLRFQGALSDALSWFGGEDITHDVKDVISGKVPITEKAKEAALAPVVKIINGIRPDIKTVAELLAGESYYPDPFFPRPIRDNIGHVARLFSLNSITDYLTGKPKRGGGSVGAWLMNDIVALGVYTSDPGEAAFWNTKKLAYNYLDKIDVEKPRITPTKKSNAMYYYKRALKYGDLKAAEKYLKKYVDLGGTRRGMKLSIKYSSTLGMMSKKQRRAFLKTLTEQEKQTLEIARGWYKETYKNPKNAVAWPSEYYMNLQNKED